MISIIQYNAGNTRSVKNALARLGYESVITNDINQLKKAEKVIFPGVGQAGSAMKYLQKTGLDEYILQLHQPFLGICLGMQLMCSSSEEGDTNCLGIFDSKVKAYPPAEIVLHMGWDNFESVKGTLFSGITAENHVYFANRFYTDVCAETIAVCNYILPFSAAMKRDNFYATQFHPEKSGKVGERILLNFLEL
jgi:glutamine amidotransferase